METPLSTRRITRSHTKATVLSSRKNEESKKRSRLIDITNGSPIVGLASASLSLSEATFTSACCKKTPGSGEALLRGQVKNLLQKVEKVSDISKFLSFDTGCGPQDGLKAFLNSPAGLPAPTPANTPQVLNFNSALDEFCSFGSDLLASPIEDDQLTMSKVMNGMMEITEQPGIGLQSENDMISRSLFEDFSEKSDCSSVMTFQGSGEPTVVKGSKLKSPLKDEEDDDASIWSIQVNLSTRDEDEDEDEDEGYGEVEDGGEEAKSELDELCEGINNIAMNDETPVAGKHIRFVYDSEDEEIEEVEEVLHLKGLPTPKGKHRRFLDEETV